jgi:hypothetical protein
VTRRSATRGAALFWWGIGAATRPVAGVPQSAQNFPVTAAPQLTQEVACDMPHSGQNFAVSEVSLPQEAQDGTEYPLSPDAADRPSVGRWRLGRSHFAEAEPGLARAIPLVEIAGGMSILAVHSETEEKSNMAQRIQVLLVCDLHDDETPGTETVTFTLDGASYEIDLCEQHAVKMRERFAPYVGAGRRAGGRGDLSGGRPRRRRSRGSGDAARIREWARSQGLPVPERGRIPAELAARYAAANPR